MPAAEIMERLTRRAPRLLAAAGRLPRRDPPRRRRLGLGLPDPPWPLPRSPRRHRALDRRAPRPPGRWRPVRRRPAGPRPRRLPGAGRARSRAQFDDARADGPAGPLGWRRDHPGLDVARPRRPPRRLGRGGRPGDRCLPAARPLAGRPRRGHRRLERAPRGRVTRRDPAATLARYDATPGRPARRDRRP